MVPTDQKGGRKRQSPRAPSVRSAPKGKKVTNEAAERATLVGRNIRAAMDRLGWVDGDKYDVRRLADAIECRWQTAQEWVLGETVPGPRYQGKLATVLGVTLDDLAGIALGHEPTSLAWREFLESSEGRTMTAEERPHVARLTLPDGREPTALSYAMQLATIRTGRAVKATGTDGAD